MEVRDAGIVKTYDEFVSLFVKTNEILKAIKQPYKEAVKIGFPGTLDQFLGDRKSVV